LFYSTRIITLIAKHAFTPIHNKRLQNLCGPGDENLRQIEMALQVTSLFRERRNY
jgi:phosphate starvation-inducible protein PhoH